MLTSRCTCGFYTKLMSSDIQKLLFRTSVVLSLLTVLSCTSKKTKLVNLLNDPENGLLQEKEKDSHSIIIQLLPALETTTGTATAATGFYKLKLVLQSKEKIKDKAIMGYMNFGIKNILYAVQGVDSLRCSICERVPGIRANEYVYIVIFDRPVKKETACADLRLFVADTIAGFGTTVFEIKATALVKLETIK